MERASPSCPDRRPPVETVAHCVGPCFRFLLGFRQGEELVLQRGGSVPRRRSTFGQGRESQGTVRAGEFGGGEKSVGNHPGQRLGGDSVFAFRTLRPCPHEIRQR